MDGPAAQRTELLLQQESVKMVLENSCADLIYPKGIFPPPRISSAKTSNDMEFF